MAGSPAAIDRRHALALGAGALAASGGTAIAERAKPIKVSAIYTLAIDQPFVSRVHKALKAAEARGDITYKFSEKVSGTDYESVIRQYSQEGADLIAGDAFAVEREVRRVAADYPKTAYLMGSGLGPTRPNLAVFDAYLHEPCFLAGMVAGRVTAANVIGLVGAYPVPQVNRLMHAFIGGALSVNPDARFLVAFIESWQDAAKAREAALAQIHKGADILFAGLPGVADAAKERGVKAVGTITDTAAQYPGTIIASALWNMEPTVEEAIRRIMDERFAAADYAAYSYMAEGGASLAPLDPKLVPQAVIDAALAKEKEIKDGLFRVKLDESEPKPTAAN